MHIAIVARGDVTRDPHACAQAAMLRGVGHRVTIVCRAAHDPVPVPDVRVVAVEDPGEPRWRRRLRRVGMGPDGAAAKAARLVDAFHVALATAAPDLVHLVREQDLDLVPAGGPPVVGQPGWTGVPRDLVELAPRAPALAADTVPSAYHTPADARGSTAPPPEDRHDGVTIAVAARFTPTNPSRYLLAALERAGVDVVPLDGVLDWDRVPPSAAAVLVVESPYPALEVRGTRPPDVPLLFWVHHGEHHVDANVRLEQRYGADAILLAHSWHLAHRFRAPVHRFPFAVAPEVFDGGLPFADRDVDVAMVAAGLDQDDSVRYPTRVAWRHRLAALGDRAMLTYGVPPEEMAALYGRARIVLNDGGTRHRPITMRVFEATGAGALLVSEPLPGMEVLFDPDHWEVLDADVLAQVERLAGAPRTGQRAAAAHRHVLARHTYDHRVDELLTAAAETVRLERPTPEEPTGVAAVVARDVEVGTVATLGPDIVLPDRAVSSGADARERLARGRFDTVVLGPDAPRSDVEVGVAGARRYLVVPERTALVEELVATHHGDEVTWSSENGWWRIDLGAPGYRERSADHPLAG